MTYRIACLLLGLIIAAYWGRVVRMAHKTRMRTGRAANFVPAERVGGVLRTVWAPVVVLWIVHPFVNGLLARPPGAFRPLLRSAALGFAGAALAAVCFGATRACWKKMGKQWRMGIDPAERTALVIDGPFAYVRHPIYALSQAMMLASTLAIPSPLMIALAVLHIGLMQWEAAREERHLLRVHGQAYAEYRARVGRFIPAFTRRSGAGL